jgi:ATP adenylyltransferase
MDRLWSPWRLAYVTASHTSTDCIFCDAGTEGGHDLLLLRGRYTFVILVAPNRHVKTLASLSGEEQAELMAMARWAEMALTETYQPQGINVGINLGKAAGAGIEDHLHVHLVPRWVGDTSFMTTVGETRVLPEELSQTAARLRPIFERLATTGA